MTKPSFSQIEARARAAADTALASSGPPAAARAAIDEADAFMAETARVLGLGPKLDKLACAKGCSYCCHQMVGVTVAELALMAEAVIALPAPDREAAAQRILSVAKASEGMDPGSYWATRMACPLLDDQGECVIHDARPLPCRAMNSADAGICKAAFDGTGDVRRIPVLAAQHGIYGHAQAALANAMKAGGIKPGPFPLAPGLAVAFTDKS